ncbi:MAG: radical SAM family heme chaperone HemW [Bacilli bacterium]|nr:radical SAM family heme chaperone HemW [Bacilli bacterium]
MIGVYIHIPFCKTICSYCDFCKMFYNQKWSSSYLDSLEKEIDSLYQGEEVSTIYIGGGTPNCLSYNELERLFKIINKFKKNKNIEYTIECNVELLNRAQIKLFKEYGINRVSIGVQTFNPKFLKLLNRHHTKEDVFNKINMLKEEGITNINVDFIYALPGQTLEDLDSDIRLFKELNIPHISTYSLIIEKHTLLNNMNIKNIDEDLDFAMYNLICSRLNLYKHYETSNFAKPGYESKHNLSYWENLNYYGFGLGASGYLKNIRYENTHSLTKYLNGNYLEDKEELTKNETIENEFILGLRKINGININKFYKKYNIDIMSIDVVNELLKEGKLVNDGMNIKLSKDYIYTANGILMKFLGVDYEK